MILNMYVCPTYYKEELKLLNSYVIANTSTMVVSPCGLTPIGGKHLWETFVVYRQCNI
jgi:hypothetical protein